MPTLRPPWDVAVQAESMPSVEVRPVQGSSWSRIEKILAVALGWRAPFPTALGLFLASVLAAALPAEAAATPVPLGKGASAPAELVLGFEEAVVIAAGLTPNGEALLFSIAREPERYLARIVRRDESLLVDPAGEVRYQAFDDGSPLPLHAVWVVVDLETGKLAHATTPGFEAPARPLPAGGILRGPGGRFSRFASRLGEAQVLLVRPAAPAEAGGAPAEPAATWGGYWMDGSGRDRDGAQDGSLEAALEDLVPLTGGGPPPEELAPGDLVVLVDPSSLGYFVVRIAPADLERSPS